MKDKIIRFLYAIDCYLLYLLSGIVAAAGVVAYYSITAARDYGYIGEDTDVAAFVDYVADFVAGKASLVLLVSYVLVILTVVIVFAFLRKRLEAYTGMSYVNVMSLIAAALLGVVLNLVANSIIPAELTQVEEINAMLILCVVLGPFVEELMFRGVLLKMFASSCGIILASIVTSVLFSVMHTGMTQMFYTFVLGLVLCLVRVSSTSLWTSVSLHLAFNITGALTAFCVPSFDGISLIMLSLAAIMLTSAACMGGRRAKKEKVKDES